jgi:type I restriction enzyme S subunit
MRNAVPATESDLPEGWARACLPELANINMGQSPPGSTYNKQMRGLPFFQGKAEFGERYPTVRVWCTQPKKIAKPGDVLISVRAPVGPTNVADRECAIGRGLAGLSPLAGTPTEFLLFALRLQEPELSLKGTGSTFTAISKDDLEEIEINVSPLAEQKQIVEKVEQLLARVKLAGEHLARAPIILKRFRQAVLAAACSGRLTADWREKNSDVEPAFVILEKLSQDATGIKTRRGVPEAVDVPDELAEPELPQTWSLQSVASLLRVAAFVDVKDGNHGSNHPKANELGDQGLPFITAAQVKNYHIDYEGAPKVRGGPLRLLKVGFAEIGDAILTHKGTVGRTAVNTQSCVLTPQTTYYRCNPSVLHSQYLVYFFSSRFFYSQLAAVMSQTTRDFVPISEQYRQFIFLPPLEEQCEIVRRVEALFKLADAIEEGVAAATARAEKLTQAILAKAFRGELVPTEAELARREGRSYEPASALLARIRAERESFGVSAKSSTQS